MYGTYCVSTEYILNSLIDTGLNMYIYVHREIADKFKDVSVILFNLPTSLSERYGKFRDRPGMPSRQAPFKTDCG